MAEDSAPEIIDYNQGDWSVEKIREGYAAYCKSMDLPAMNPLLPHEHKEEAKRWIYPILDEVIRGIEQGDLACIALGVDFIEDDQHLPFGKTLKSNAARALRRAELSETQKERIRRRVVSMLLTGIIPHEFREYIKLLKRVGFEDYRTVIASMTPPDNPYAVRFRCSLLGE